MRLPTIQQFVDSAKSRLERGVPSSTHVQEHGFRHLYVRLTKLTFFGGWTDFFVIANVEASRKRKGTFGRLLDRLLKDHNVQVECVLNPRLADFLARRGFTRDGNHHHKLKNQPGD